MQRVKIHFYKFDIEKHASCDYDAVRIKDSRGTHAYCGNKIPADYMSSSNYALVYFKTDSSRTGGGFSATFTTVGPHVGKSINYGWHVMVNQTEVCLDYLVFVYIYLAI